ncbi:MAG: peptide chain release factor N(5)-glutamine methyltransferase [bacterium]
MTALVSATLRQRIDETAARLEEAGLESPRAEAEALLEAVTGIPHRHALYQADRDLTSEESEHLDEMIVRRLAGEPLQYIAGEAAFRMLTLTADRRALIPRPETEGIVDLSLRLGDRDAPLEVLDACTGGGAVALAMAMEAPRWSILAADASPAALELARENHERYEMARVQWLEADVTSFAFWRMIPPLDLVVSNPPYVRTGEWEDLPREIREHEPREALEAGPGGMDVIAPLLEGASMRVKPSGHIIVEIGETQSEPVQETARSLGFQEVRTAPDLSGRPRYLIARQRTGGA